MLLSLAFAAGSKAPSIGDFIKLEKWANGRTSQDMRRDAGNIYGILAPKTSGEIIEIKKFQTGRYALKIKITDTPSNSATVGKELWVYYDPEKEVMTLTDKETKKKTEVVDDADSVTTVKEVPFIEREEDSIKEQVKTDDAIKKEEDKNRDKLDVIEIPDNKITTVSLVDDQLDKTEEDKNKDELDIIEIPDNKITTVSLVNDLLDKTEAEIKEKTTPKITEDCTNCTSAVEEEIAIRSCELKVGEALKVNNPFYKSPTETSQNYLLKRSGPKAYEAKVNLQFSSSGAADTIAPDEMQRLAKSCLKDFSPYMKGPNGESLTITLYDEITDKAQLPVSGIAIQRAGIRATSHRWKSDIDCPTLIHEVMHILGLVDHYHEKIRGVVIDSNGSSRYYDGTAIEDKKIKLDDGRIVPVAFDCRSLGPENSMMSNQYQASDCVKPVEKYDLRTCKCDTDAYCNQVKKMFPDPIMSPNAYCPGEGLTYIYEGVKLSQVAGNYAIISIENYKVVEPICKSLLMPAEFRFITTPNCKEDYKTYASCALNSSRTSVEERCKEVPAICQTRDGSWLK